MSHRYPVVICLLASLLAGCLSPGQRIQAQQAAEPHTPGTASAQVEAETTASALQLELFSPQWLRDHARELASRPYSPEIMDENNPLRALDYDDYRRIEFDPDAAMWWSQERDFTLQLFHPGFLYTMPVDIHLVSAGAALPVPFTTEVFRYGEGLGDIGQSRAQGYAGFRVHYPINTSERLEEFLVFLGASYFRSVGENQFYGLSARGLAINTVGPGGEEFPRFSAFWIEEPAAGTDEIVIHALLNSQSVTGAYHFTVEPGEYTRIEVDAHLYPRREMDHVGIAPLTSMFLFDTTNRSRFDDFRNAVHDSDGLQILQANGEQVWRALANPSQLQVSSFMTATPPVGFGLLQRHREFDDFNDNEARYDKRTSLWIEVLGDWEAGHVELVEIPTDEEVHDNIVAYWKPAAALEAGGEYRYRYRMHWGPGSPSAVTQGRITNTAVGTAIGSGEKIFVIDFSEGHQIPDVMSDPEAVRIQVSTSAGTITDVSGKLVDATGDYRAYIKVDLQNASLAELRATLEVDSRQWGETWLYRWTP